VHPFQFPANESAQRTIFIGICVQILQFPDRAETSDGRERSSGTLPGFGQFFFISEAIDEDTYCPTTSQVLQTLNCPKPYLGALILATVNQRSYCTGISAVSKSSDCPDPNFLTPAVHCFFDEAVDPICFWEGTVPFISHSIRNHTHDAPEFFSQNTFA
jgi:hypothetical protein